MQTTAENILDVTLLEPRQKHPTIFVRFDELAAGEHLTIHNDHDPKPLYYQLIGERGNIFTWEYLEQGPEWWIVKISKKIAGENEETLGQIAAKDLRKAQVDGLPPGLQDQLRVGRRLIGRTDPGKFP